MYQTKQELRKRAEALHRSRKNRHPAAQHSDTELLIHELEVHQIELELQNEELRVIQAQLESSLEQFRDLFDLAPVGYLTLGREGIILGANLTVCSLLNVPRNELTGSSVFTLAVADSRDALFRHLRRTFQDDGRNSCEIEVVRRDGNRFYAQLESVRESRDDDSEFQCLTVLRDVTERHQQERLIHRQANFDALTNLPNRSLFLDRLSYSIRTAQREGTRLALFYVDLDKFKWVNDTYGHNAGDRVLVETATRLLGCARENDTVGRLSGDEFCMLLPLVGSPQNAGLVANKVMAAMESPFHLEESVPLRIACSVGIAMYPKDADSPEALLKAADVALYQAKRNGRGQFAFFTSVLNEQILRQQTLGLQLQHAVTRSELMLQYQPVISLQSGRPVGAEVLLRWQHPELGLLMPCEFVPIAESNGAIVEIGEWIIREVHRRASVWYQQGLDLPTLWVNLSARQCSSESRAIRLTNVLKSLGDWFPKPRLGLEITESDVLDVSDPVMHMFNLLHDDGVAMSIDDFGTGFSSLKRLRQIPFDIIKIDQSFIVDIETSQKSVDLVRAIIALGHSMGAKVVAEGIETYEQRRILEDLECDLGQGFCIALPMNHENLAAYIASN